MAAGKVTGSGGPTSGGIPAAEEADKSHKTAETSGEAGGPSFADRLASTAGPARARESGAAPAAGGATADLAAQLGSGKITAKAAIDRVIDRVVDRQVGADAPAAVREQVRAALETAVADDPLLSEKIKTLGS